MPDRPTRTEAPRRSPRVAAQAARANQAARATRAARAARTRLAAVDRRRVRRLLPVVLLTLASAAIAYGVVSLIVDSDPTSPSAATFNAARGWIGVEMTNSPDGNGALIVSVVPGSPAAAAGLQPGDILTEIDHHPVSTPNGVTSRLANLHAGDRVDLQVQRGPLQYDTQTTLAARPAGSP